MTNWYSIISIFSMSTNYKELISFARLKECLQERNVKVKDFAEKIGIHRENVSIIICGVSFPKTDLIARICRELNVPASEICLFRDIEISPYFRDKELLYKPAADAAGEVTYRPLRRFLEEYLNEHKGKTADDLFDKIEPARRRNNVYCGFTKEVIQRALEARGITEGYEVKEKRSRRDYSSGLPYATRTKLRQDRPLNIRNIYDICKYLGCSIDFVMSYK